MDYQCLFQNNIYDEDSFLQWSSRRDDSKISSNKERSTGSVKQLLFKHIQGHSNISVEVGSLAADAVETLSLEVTDAGEYARLRLLITPPRTHAKDQYGRLAECNPEAQSPFDQRTFKTLVEKLHFHKACLAHADIGQISMITSPRSITSIYFETYSYRHSWFMVSLSYNPYTMTTSTFLHNFSHEGESLIISKLTDPSTRRLTIHPMLVPTLVYELLFSICIKELHRLFQSSIHVEHSMGLNNNSIFAHFAAEDMDIEEASKKSFGDGQAIAYLEERIEFNLLLGRKLLTYFPTIRSTSITARESLSSSQIALFNTAHSTISNRLHFLIETLEMQLPRLARTKAHTALNLSGLETKQTSQGNKIQYQIAIESKADSSAMKAISLLTMFFLPGTFVAAFFAMPLFDWDAPRVVKDRFWVYWAVTIPATLLVLAAWRTWWIFEEWQQHRERNVKRGFFAATGVWFSGRVGRNKRGSGDDEKGDTNIS